VEQEEEKASEEEEMQAEKLYDLGGQWAVTTAVGGVPPTR
jgi:hypothetical protein